jgi:hypothetical protein
LEEQREALTIQIKTIERNVPVLEESIQSTRAAACSLEVMGCVVWCGVVWCGLCDTLLNSCIVLIAMCRQAYQKSVFEASRIGMQLPPD